MLIIRARNTMHANYGAKHKRQRPLTHVECLMNAFSWCRQLTMRSGINYEKCVVAYYRIYISLRLLSNMN